MWLLLLTSVKESIYSPAASFRAQSNMSAGITVTNISGRGGLMVKVTNSWRVSHELDPSTAVDRQRRGG
ncbi:hypothetical protein TNCV_2863561 [Trichonephila clavipes]|nr:hypothetical protein TNCV_2863561 [Trichonephila clavipes]